MYMEMLIYAGKKGDMEQKLNGKTVYVCDCENCKIVIVRCKRMQSSSERKIRGKGIEKKCTRENEKKIILLHKCSNQEYIRKEKKNIKKGFFFWFYGSAADG